METKRTFKKELSRDQLLAIALKYLKQIDNESDRVAIAKLLERMTAEIVTAVGCHLWLVDHEKKIFVTETLEKGHVELPWGKGLLSKALEEERPFYVNIVHENRAYDPVIDNPGGYGQKDIILLPVTDEGGTIRFILKAFTSKQDLQQFTDNDLSALRSITPYLADMYPLLRNGREEQSGTTAGEDSEAIVKLRAEKERAEAMVDSSTQFLAEVAHEIRTPMNAVMGFIDLLKVSESDKEKLMYLESAAKSGEMMIALINDLLDFSKIEKGMMELESINFNPAEEFVAMAPLFCARMKKKNIRFNLFIDPRLPREIATDPHRIKQILSNLLGNAIKFTPENGQVTLEVLYVAASKRIDFSVIDTGIGIARENQAKIFQAYKQETDATTRKFGGTGLGLSISSKLAEKLGDGLKLESELGKGSRFYFSVPLEDAVISAESMFDFAKFKTFKPVLVFSDAFLPTKDLLLRYFDAFGIDPVTIPNYHHCLDVSEEGHLFVSQDLIDYPAAQKRLDSGASMTIFKSAAFDFFTEDLKGAVTEIDCTFGPNQLYDLLTPPKPVEAKAETALTAAPTYRKILVVDDNPLNVHFMREVLKKLGGVVESASDGTEAIEVYKRIRMWQDSFDLILMDENMPKMTGSEAAKIICNLEKSHGYEHTPIVGISGDATEKQREASMAAGMDECIFKPVGLKKITEIFERFLG